MLWLDFWLKDAAKLSIGDEMIYVECEQSCSYEMKRCGHFMDMSTVILALRLERVLAYQTAGY